MILALYSMLTVYALWVFFLAAMNLKRARDAGKLSRPALVLGTPVVWIGLALDLASNVLLSVPFLDLPRETTVTYRLKRYAKGQDGWRKRVALWAADDLLDDFDPSGRHV